MRRLIVAIVSAVLLAAMSLSLPDVRSRVKAIVRPEAPPRITPLAVSAPPAINPTATRQPTASPTVTATSTSRSSPTAEPSITPTSTATPEPSPSPTPTAISVNGRIYDAYIPAATKAHQFYQYSCEFDAAWVILATYGINVSGDELIARIDHDRRIEPYIEETRQGFVIHGGNITDAYSGDYTKNFLARSTGTAMRKLFERYGLETTLVQDRAALEAALRSGELVWMKTTVDFKPWRPATWVMPDGRTHATVLGNDHAVVAMGYSDRGVVIRDVLGPTSTNQHRPYEYEVDWDTFMAAWGAQSFDALAVARPSGAR